MDYRTFEQKLLDTIFTTDVPLNPATIAFLYKLTVQQASDLLQQAAVNGLLNIESDEEGNLLYTYPNRVRLPRDGKLDPRRDPAAQNKAVPVALVPTAPPALVKSPPAEPAPLPDSIDLLEASTPRDESRSATGAATAQTPPPLPSAAAREAQGSSMRCPFCSEVILVGAKKCKHCHEFLDFALRDIQALRQPGIPHAPLGCRLLGGSQWVKTRRFLGPITPSIRGSAASASRRAARTATRRRSTSASEAQSSTARRSSAGARRLLE